MGAQSESGRVRRRRLPRLAPDTLERPRLAGLLGDMTSVPLHVLCAPIGFGKTTYLVQRAKAGKNTIYLELQHDTTEDQLRIDIAEAVGRPSAAASYRYLIDAFEEFALEEFIIDAVERASPGINDLLRRFVRDIPYGMSLIYAGRRTMAEVPEWQTRGIAAVAASDTLLFNEGEMHALFGLATNNGEEVVSESLFAEILQRTDGWPIVVADIARRLRGPETIETYDQWVEEHAGPIGQMLQREFSDWPQAMQTNFRRLAYGEFLDTAERDGLITVGAPFLVTGKRNRPITAALELLPTRDSSLPDRRARIALRMFGRFSARLGDREVAWVRRRDQQIFRYIVLRPDGRTTKDDIIAQFWPNGDPQAAGQSLRTAISNIRKALVSAFGVEVTSALLKSEGREVSITMDMLVMDVTRFKANVYAGTEQEEAGNIAEALAHFQAAQRIYRDDLFSGEPVETWYLSHLEAYREMYAMVKDRVAYLQVELGDIYKGSTLR